jgi:hypothetical protein
VEEEIAKLEQEKASITKRMAEEGFGSDAEEVRALAARYAAVEAALEKVFTQWSDVSEELERAEKALGVEA